MMHSEQRKQVMAEVEAELVEAIKQGNCVENMYPAFCNQYPYVQPETYYTAVQNAWHEYRKEVAWYAAYCAGSCHGDASAEAFKAWRDVMESDFAFGRMHDDYKADVARRRAAESKPNGNVPPWAQDRHRQ